MRAVEMLIEYESMMHASVERVGRAVRNMRQEMGGFPSTTPGNGSPGGGKGGRPTVSLADPSDPVDPDGADVVVTSVETQVLFGRDDAADDLARLRCSAEGVIDGAEAILVVDHGIDPGPGWDDSDRVGADRLAVLGYQRILMLRDVNGVVARRLHDHLEHPVTDLFGLCQRWGYDVERRFVPKDRAELLAVDLTGLWCRSHLRVGERRERDRGELCQWCRKFEALEGFVPPVDLVRVHVEFKRVREDQVRPFRQAHQDRQRRKVKGSPR